MIDAAVRELAVMFGRQPRPALEARLRAARRARGLTQHAAAAAWAVAAGTSNPGQSFVAKCESGRRRLRWTEAVLFARIYRVSFAWLCERRPLDTVPAPESAEPAADHVATDHVGAPSPRRRRGRLGTAAPRGIPAARPLTDPARRQALSDAIRRNRAAHSLRMLSVSLWCPADHHTGPHTTNAVSAFRALDLSMIDMVNTDGESLVYEVIQHGEYGYASTLIDLGATVLARQTFTAVDPRPRRRDNPAVPLTPWELIVDHAQPDRQQYRARATLNDPSLGELMIRAIRAISDDCRQRGTPPGDLRIRDARRAIRAVVRSTRARWNRADLYDAAVEARRQLEALHRLNTSSPSIGDGTAALFPIR